MKSGFVRLACLLVIMVVAASARGTKRRRFSKPEKGAGDARRHGRRPRRPEVADPHQHHAAGPDLKLLSGQADGRHLRLLRNPEISRPDAHRAGQEAGCGGDLLPEIKAGRSPTRARGNCPTDQVQELSGAATTPFEAAMRVWLKDPKTVLIYDGQNLVERHLADQTTLINAENDSITIQTDAETHLPLRRS